MLDLIAQTNKKLQVPALRRVVGAVILPQTFREIPMFGIPVHFHVANCRTRPSVPGASSSLVRHRVKQCRPGKHYQDYEMRGPKSRPRTVIDIHSRNRSRAALLQIVLDGATQTFWHDGYTEA